MSTRSITLIVESLMSLHLIFKIKRFVVILNNLFRDQLISIVFYVHSVPKIILLSVLWFPPSKTRKKRASHYLNVLSWVSL